MKTKILRNILLSVGVFFALTELQATPSVAARAIDISTADSLVEIDENGDGTAFVFLIIPFDDGTFLFWLDPAVPTYSVSNDLQPGHSGHGRFSGAGYAALEAEIFDPNTGTLTDVAVEVNATVTGADNVEANLQQGVNSVRDPFTGEISILRVHSVGSDAWSLTAGSFSISLDGTVAKQESGGWGMVTTFSTHTVQHIR